MACVVNGDLSSSPISSLDTVSIVDKLPAEIFVYLCSFLEIQDIKTLSFVCRRWKILAEDDGIWKPIAIKQQIAPDLESKEPIKIQIVKKRKLIQFYSKGLIATFGNFFEQLPMLTLDKNEKIEGFGTKLKLKKITAPIMRIHNAAAIIFRYINQEADPKTSIFEVIFKSKTLQTKDVWHPAFISYTGMQKWFNKCSKLPTVIHCFPGDERKFEYIRRLIEKKPCGIYDFRSKSEVQLLTNGTSTVYLV